MKSLLIAVALFTVAGIGYAINGNPSSNVLYDSANTANNLVARDANGSFAAGQIILLQETTTQLLTLVPISTGAVVAIAAATPSASAFGVCVSSGVNAGQWVYLSTGAANAAHPCI